jgi:hypothetical protein
MHPMDTVGGGGPSKKRPALSLLRCWRFRNDKVGLESPIDTLQRAARTVEVQNYGICKLRNIVVSLPPTFAKTNKKIDDSHSVG